MKDIYRFQKWELIACANRQFEHAHTRAKLGPIVPLTVRYSPSSEVQTSSFTSAAMNKPNLSSLFLLSEKLKITEVSTTMISVAYRTSLKMFCDVELHFLQLLKARVSDCLHFDFHFSDENVPSSKKLTF